MRAKRDNHFISFIALVSMVGMALGVMVLITVLSVMNGFERELRERILGLMPHLSIQEASGQLSDWQSVRESLLLQAHVKAVLPQISIQALAKAHGRHQFIMVNGVVPEYELQATPIADYMQQGSLQDLAPGEFGAVIGAPMARYLGVTVGDTVVLALMDNAQTTPAGMIPRLKRVTIRGIFETRAAEIDSGMMFVSLSDAAKLARMGESVSALRLVLDDVFIAPRLGYELRSMLPLGTYTVNWTQTHGNLFQAIKMEKHLMFLMLTLIVAVAAFNIVSTLVMVVYDKRADIAILRTYGATPRMIMTVFIMQGLMSGVIGILIGTVLGVLLANNVTDLVAWIEQLSGAEFLSGDVYFINFLPSELIVHDVYTIVGSAVLMCLLATLYPAWNASRVHPVEALRDA